MYYVYIIYSKKLNKKYIGSTENLRNRIIEHNSGKSDFTSKGIPWKLLYYEAFENKIDALREERFLKTGKGRKRISYLFGEVAEWSKAAGC
ncbi:MAG: GIY-YIG nuclease family protein [bacterium]